MFLSLIDLQIEFRPVSYIQYDDKQKYAPIACSILSVKIIS